MVINQLIGLYECKDDILKDYYDKCQDLLGEFPFVTLKHIPRAQNQEANHLVQSSRYRLILEILNNEVIADDWRIEIADYLRNPS